MSKFTNSKNTGGFNKFKRNPNEPRPEPKARTEENTPFKSTGKFTMATKWGAEPETWKEAEEKKRQLELMMANDKQTEQKPKEKSTFKISGKANLKLGGQNDDEKDKEAIIQARLKALEEKEKAESKTKETKTTSKLFKNTKKVKLGTNDEEQRELERKAALDLKRKMEMEMGIKPEPIKQEQKKQPKRKVSTSNNDGKNQGTTTGAKW